MKEKIIIEAHDGFHLGATLFRNQSSNAPLVIIAAATAVRQRYYAKFAQFLTRNGFHALTFDYRGIGESRLCSLKDFKAKIQDWGELDLTGVINWSAEAKPGQIFLIGHSVAGQIFPLAKNNSLVKAAYFVASQSAYWKLWDGIERAKVLSLWYFLIPTLTTLYGYFPGRALGNAEDLPSGVARQWARWARHRHYILSENPDVLYKFKQVYIPLKFISFSDDTLMAPKKAVETLISWYGSPNKEHVHIRPQEISVPVINHFGFFKEEFSNTLWNDAVQWLKVQLRKSDEAKGIGIGQIDIVKEILKW